MREKRREKTKIKRGNEEKRNTLIMKIENEEITECEPGWRELNRG